MGNIKLFVLNVIVKAYYGLEAFEMWVWRRMLKISWVDKVSNAEVLRKVHESMSILNTAQQWKLGWIGHILRYESLLCDVIEGRMMGTATREGNDYKC